MTPVSGNSWMLHVSNIHILLTSCFYKQPYSMFSRIINFIQTSKSSPSHNNNTMQSLARLRSLRFLNHPRNSSLLVARASSKPDDSAVHSQSTKAENVENFKKSDCTEEQSHQNLEHSISISKDPTHIIKTPPFASSGAPLKNSGIVNPTVDPTFHQKRHFSILDEVSCVGVDGTPLNASNKEERNEEEYWESRGIKEENEDYKEYYQDRKPSPLSEIEFVDTRLPITRATDGEKKDSIWGGEGRGYYIEDTVDDSLERAQAMFNEARERGDPTMPHSRALWNKIRELYNVEIN